jgi:hypothetical protein
MKLRDLLADANVVFLCYGTITLRVNLVTAEIWTLPPSQIRLSVPAFGRRPAFRADRPHRSQFVLSSDAPPYLTPTERFSTDDLVETERRTSSSSARQPDHAFLSQFA